MCIDNLAPQMCYDVARTRSHPTPSDASQSVRCARRPRPHSASRMRRSISPYPTPHDASRSHVRPVRGLRRLPSVWDAQCPRPHSRFIPSVCDSAVDLFHSLRPAARRLLPPRRNPDTALAEPPLIRRPPHPPLLVRARPPVGGAPLSPIRRRPARLRGLPASSAQGAPSSGGRPSLPPPLYSLRQL